MQIKHKFDNGYGASVIDHGYGSDQGLFEVGVLGPDGREIPAPNEKEI